MDNSVLLKAVGLIIVVLTVFGESLMLYPPLQSPHPQRRLTRESALIVYGTSSNVRSLSSSHAQYGGQLCDGLH